NIRESNRDKKKRRKKESEANNIKLKSSTTPVGREKKEQQIVDLARLPGKIGSAVDFLREHVKSLNGRVSTKGNQIQVEGLKHKEVKLLLHKFLRHNGLDDHRVLSQSGILEIVPPHLVTHTKQDAASTPPLAAA